MSDIVDLITKAGIDITSGPATVTGVHSRSVAEIRNFSPSLSRHEAQTLHDHFSAEKRANKLTESSVLSRANPQLRNAVQLGISQLPQKRSYDDLFGPRSSKYVKSDSVASMFSPAGYLTELYREAKDLHKDTSVYHLDKRRPDLASLALSQQNMDEEVSTLSLSNNLLMDKTCDLNKTDRNGVLKMLSTYRLSGMTPFNYYYEAIRQVVQLRDPELSAFTRNPQLAALMDPASLLAVENDVSPELYNILTEEITAENSDELLKKNFGDINTDALKSNAFLAQYYGISYEVLDGFYSLVQADPENVASGHYKNDKLLVMLPGHDETTTAEVMLIERTYLDNPDQLNYLEIFPTGEDTFKCKCNVTKHTTTTDLVQFGSNGSGSDDILHSETYSPAANYEMSFDCYPGGVTRDKLLQGVTVGLTRTNTTDSSSFYCSARFKAKILPYSSFALMLNKILRLYKATGLSIDEIFSIIYSVSDSLIIDAAVLRQLFYTRFAMQRYALDVSDAIVISGGEISQTSTDDSMSQFTQLFNTPLINDITFVAGGTVIDLTSPDTDKHTVAVLKRAMGINEGELQTLAQLASGDASTFSCSLKNLSALYRTRLLAGVHGLTVDGLDRLLSLSAWAGSSLITLDSTALFSLTNFLYQSVHWLDAQGLTEADAFIMVTAEKRTVRTPDVDNLVTSLRNGLSDSSELTGDVLINQGALYVAAVLQLDSAGTAANLIHWTNDLLHSQALSFYDFWQLISNADNENQTEDEIAANNLKILTYSQVLNQLSLVVRSTGITSAELDLIVSRPEHFTGDATVALSLDILQQITAFHAMLTRCGNRADEVLTALSEGTLTVGLLARALSLDVRLTEEALNQTISGAPEGEPADIQNTVISSWRQIDAILQWTDVCTTLNVSPSTLAALFRLKYTAQTETPSFSDWQSTGNLFLAGLDTQQASALHAILDERLSAALSVWLITSKSISTFVTSRDDLYSYLLIDNQVSSAIKTTRLEEAIASVQLYINRALNNAESDVDMAVSTRQFFIDWEMYNKRYSTWQGVSLLAYYPENYIDPTLRTGQTRMMDEMLQTLSQSKLSRDTVEDAFKTYLTRFEVVANLELVSAYHDNVNISEGKTWIVGRNNTEGDKYYWRTLNQAMMSEGKYPADAWSEWTEISIGASPWNGLIRPVIFNDRLYIVWLERKAISMAKNKNDTASSDASSTSDAKYHYVLKYGFLRQDGSWSSPFSIELSEDSNFNDIDFSTTALYCAYSMDGLYLIIYFYKRQDTDPTSLLKEQVDDKTLLKGLDGIELHIFNDNSAKSNTNADLTAVVNHLDYAQHRKINQPVLLELSVPASADADTGWGTGGLAINQSSTVSQLEVNADGDNVTLKFKAKNSIKSYGYSTSPEHIMINMLKKFSAPSDEVFFSSSPTPPFPDGLIDIFYYYQVDSVNHIPFVYNKTASKIYIHAEGIASPTKFECIFSNTFYHNDSSTPIECSIDLNAPVADDQYVIDVPEDFSPESYKYGLVIVSSDEGYYSFIIQGLYPYDFTPALDKVIVSIKAGSVYKSWNARDNIPAEQLPELNTAGMEYYFDMTEQGVDIPVADFVDNKLHVTVEFSANTEAGRNLGIGKAEFDITRKADDSAMEIYHTDTDVQYLQRGAFRVRANTLFARQLIARANQGLDAILSMETQNIQEPQLGDGVYIRIDFPVYSQEQHGDGSYKLYLIGETGERSKDLVASGQVSRDGPSSVTLFAPYIPKAKDEDAENKDIMVGITYSDKDLTSNYADMQFFKWNDAKGNDAKGKFEADAQNTTSTRGLTSQILPDNEEPMDFSGANAIYFWEMFYYVPMMVFQRLLQEQHYDEAVRWISYVWDPKGYIVHGAKTNYTWNVRPLEEDTSWNTDPLDSVDPDAVAQADPIHYKLATFMRMLDLLIARGDAAYRLLERDTLNEAKMWYIQALTLLGDEPYTPISSQWNNPRLDEAADKTGLDNYQAAMNAVRTLRPQLMPRTANSLTNLFLPQQNEKLEGYWQTLAQRLYNLRHNLSIDGQPLSLSVYAAAADPAALLNAAVTAASGGADLPTVNDTPLYRFPVMLDNARSMVNQLIQFGGTLQSLIEKQDAESLSQLLQTQGSALILQSIRLQQQAIAEIDADMKALETSREDAQNRLNSYQSLWDNDINAGESLAMTMKEQAAGASVAASVLYMTSAAADMVPNIFGLADGGSRWGGIPAAAGMGIEIDTNIKLARAEKIGQTELYRRRREEWALQRDAAKAEMKQITAQLDAQTVRREAAVLQQTYIETQQSQAQAQMTFLQNKFTSKALYSWLRGKLAAIYYQFYDLTVSRCLMAERAWQWQFNDKGTSFIRPGAWQGTYAGLMAGETLMLNLAQMEQSYLEKVQREKEVTRTVCLSEVYASLGSDAFVLADEVVKLVNAGSGSAGTDDNGLVFNDKDNQLQATLKLEDLKIGDDYPSSLGNIRRIKQISVTLPALVGPYQDVRAVLSYGGSVSLPRGCTATAVSHGMNDSGQFQLDFSDSRWLPFEGIPVSDSGTLTLSFPQAVGSQKDLLLSLTDIILHIRYTIAS